MSIRAIIVGCGGMANAWVEASKKNGVEIVGFVDIFRASAERLAEKHGFPPSTVFNSLKEAVAATGATQVFDVTVPVAHDAVAIEAMTLGCDLLGEKPMSDALPKAQKMVATAKATGKTYAVMQNYRYVPGIVTVGRLIREGVIGRVEELHADFFIGAHFGGFRDQMDYPLILDMSIHTFDASRYISGADPVSVYCHSFNPKRSWYKGDASASAIFELVLPDGNPIVFNYRGSWCAEGLGTPWNSHWRIVGSKGTLTWDGGPTIKTATIKPDGNHTFVSEMIEATHPETTSEFVGHTGLMKDYLAAKAAGQTPATICTDNIKSLAMVLAAVESSKAGKKVGVVW